MQERHRQNERLNLGHILRDYQRSGCNPEFFQGYRAKVEAYALFAPVIQRAVKEAYCSRDERPPYGLAGVPELKKYTPENLDTVANGFEVTLEYFMARQLNEEQPGLSDWEKHALKTLQARFPQDETKLDLQGGRSFAGLFMYKMLMAIPTVYEKQTKKRIDAKTYLEIARNSLPMVNEVAMTNLEDLGEYRGALEGDYRNSVSFENLEVQNRNGNRSLNIAASTRQRLRKLASRSQKDEPTLGCPAMWQASGGSAIKTLWEWNVEILEKVLSKNGQKAVYRQK